MGAIPLSVLRISVTPRGEPTVTSWTQFQPKRIMEEEFEEAFQFDEGGVSWHGQDTLNILQIEILRRAGVNFFGSCSFDEPVEDLQALGLL